MARQPPPVFEQVMRNRGVQAKIRAVALRKADRARQITEEGGGQAEITVESGIRPGGRAFTNIKSDSAAEEFGTGKTARRRALGRAAREG